MVKEYCDKCKAEIDPHERLSKKVVKITIPSPQSWDGYTRSVTLCPDRFVYLMCTVHPENRFSRYNMESHGYQVKKIARCYGGLERCILLKERRR